MIQFYIKVFKMNNTTMICKNPAVKQRLPDDCNPAAPSLPFKTLTVVIFKNTHELLSCEENPALDRAELQIEIFGNLFVFESVNMHAERKTVIVMQGINGLLNLVAGIGRLRGDTPLVRG